ncbi:MAG: prolipoprotein diacylglyceryl transferase family protein [Patescibacteria group bacterium]
MWPFLEVAGIYFPAYNLALALGVLLGATALFLAARRKRVLLQFLADNFVWLMLITLVFARLTEVLLHSYSLLEFPFFWGENGGLDFYGGVIAFLLTLAWLCRHYNENFFTWLDLSVLAAFPVLILHHVGTFLAGSAYGTQTVLPWGVTFTNPDSAVLTTLVIHPTQIYAALLTLGLFITAMFILKHTTETGKAGIFLLLTVSLGYFFLDFLRGDSAITFGMLRASQYAAILLAAAAAVLVIKMKHTAREARGSEIHINNQAQNV